MNYVKIEIRIKKKWWQFWKNDKPRNLILGKDFELTESGIKLNEDYGKDTEFTITYKYPNK